MAQVVLSNKCKQPFKHALVLSSISKNISSFFKISHSVKKPPPRPPAIRKEISVKKEELYDVCL